MDYLEIEKANFEYDWNKMIKGLAGSNFDYAKKQMDILQSENYLYYECLCPNTFVRNSYL